jgi:hypothetical protein
MNKEDDLKIEGEFLRIYPEGEFLKIEYLNGRGEFDSAYMRTDNVEAGTASAEWLIGEAQKRLGEAKDPRLIHAIQKEVRRLVISVLWPEMYVAYCREGEKALRHFFTKNVNLGNVPDRSLGNDPRAGVTVWEGTKKEFAELVKKALRDHPEKYRGPQDATEKLYPLYKFPRKWKWSARRCYFFVKKVT